MTGANHARTRRPPANTLNRTISDRADDPHRPGKQTNKPNRQNTMKKLLMMTALTCAFAAQTMPAFADATSAQKEQIARAQKEVQEAVKTDEGCKAMCEAMMKEKKAKMMMCEMMMKDPDCMKVLKK